MTWKTEFPPNCAMCTTEERPAKQQKIDAVEPAVSVAAEPGPSTQTDPFEFVLTPGLPPRSDEPTRGYVGMCALESVRHGLAPPPKKYGPKDTKLWTKEQSELFRAQKTSRDVEYASQYAALTRA